jgi:hypothetical protein
VRISLGPRWVRAVGAQDLHLLVGSRVVVMPSIR